MPVLNVDGDRLHYFDEGAGTPVIFIHGSCGGRCWRTTVRRSTPAPARLQSRNLPYKWVGNGTWRDLPEPVEEIMRSGTARLYHEWLTLDLGAPSRDDLAALNLPVLLIKGSRLSLRCTVSARSSRRRSPIAATKRSRAPDIWFPSPTWSGSCH